jgi:hypothetical protein
MKWNRSKVGFLKHRSKEDFRKFPWLSLVPPEHMRAPSSFPIQLFPTLLVSLESRGTSEQAASKAGQKQLLNYYPSPHTNSQLLSREVTLSKAVSEPSLYSCFHLWMTCSYDSETAPLSLSFFWWTMEIWPSAILIVAAKTDKHT